MPIPKIFPSLIHRGIFLTGATASGKSLVAMQLARDLNAEIISVDSIAVYRGMDIGTAKPSRAEREEITHHLLDVTDPTEDYSITEFLVAVHAAVQDIEARGRLPLFVGGTPLYLKGLLRGFFAGPPPDWEFRRSVEEDVRVHGTESLHHRLSQVDPLSAHWLPPTDIRRITRALEVAYLSGQPLSHWQVQFDQPVAAEHCHVYGIVHPRESLVERIDSRVLAMFRAGLVEEVQVLLESTKRQGAALSRTASQAVGYREVIEHIETKSKTNDEIIAEVQLHTRQLSKRQMTWMRSLCEITPMSVEGYIGTKEIAQRILGRYRSNDL